MGGSESFIDNYIRQYGIEGLSKLVLLKKKISWLEENCTSQLTRKVDDQIKYILFKIDELITEKKTIVGDSYQQIKHELNQKYPQNVKKIQQKNARLLQNIYGRNQILDKLNFIKIEFHIEVHLNKKRIKKLFEQKIASIENSLLYQTNDIPISKDIIDNLFEQRKKRFDLVLDDPGFKIKLRDFKSSTIKELSFQSIFWPTFEKKMRQTQLEIENTHHEAQTNLKRMKADVRGT